MTPPDDVTDIVRHLPLGTTQGHAHGRRYVTTHSQFSNGRAHKVVAEELGGADYISLNLYRLAAGPRLYPCEMPADKVIAFLRSYVPDSAIT